MRIPFTLILFCSAFSLLSAEKITYDDHIFPIFESSCLNCHNPDKKKGGLDLSTFQGAIAGGSGGKVAMAGDGASSKLYTTTIHTEEPVMPPEGDKIDKKHADLIRTWIDEGLLENKSSKVRKAKKPSISLVIADPQKRPEGPLPMPQDLLLEPVIVPTRGTVINDMEASPWAPLLAITGQRQILLYNTDTLELVGILPFPYGTPEAVSFHPSGKYLLAAGGIGGKSGTTITWDITNGQTLMKMGKEFDSILAADIRADLGGIALGGPSRLIKIWDTQINAQILKIKKHTDWVTSLRYAPDGILLATGDRNNGIYIWEASTGNEFHTLRGHQKEIVDLKWRSDSNLVVSASEDGDIKFWEMNTGKEVKKTKAHSAILALDYSRDGHLITSGRDKLVKIWKPDLGLKKQLPNFDAEITEVEFSHDAQRFFTANWNGHIQVWDSYNYKEIGTLNSTPPTIAHRLIELRARSSTLASESAAFSSELSGYLEKLNNSENWLKSLQKKIPNFKKRQNEVGKEITLQESAQRKLEQTSTQIRKQTDQMGRETTQERQVASRLTQERTKLTKALTKARKDKASEKTIKLENDLVKLDRNIAATRDLMEQKRLAHQEKIKEQQTVDELLEKALQLKSKAQRELQQVKTQLQKAEKDLPAALKGRDWNQKKLIEAQAKVDSAKNAEERNQTIIKKWEAAEVNTELLKATHTFNFAGEKIMTLRDDLKVAVKESAGEEITRLKREIDYQSTSLSKSLNAKNTLKATYQAIKNSH